MEMENNKAKEEKPSTSTAGLAGAAGDGPSSRTWKCEGEVVSSRSIPTTLESYEFSWETTLKQAPGEKYIKSQRYVLNTGTDQESEWRIELDPNFTDANGTRYLSAYLVLEKTFTPGMIIPAIYHISLKTDFGHAIPSYIKCELCDGGISQFSAEKPSYGFAKYIPITQLGKFADPNNTEKLPIAVTLQILKEDPNPNQFSMEHDVDIEEVMEQAQSLSVPFDPDAKPNHDVFLRIGDKLLPVDSSRVNHFTEYFMPYYIPMELSLADVANPGNTVDMELMFGSRKKFEKLMEFCHTGRLQFPTKLEGVIGIVDMAAALQIAQLRLMSEVELLKRLDMTNFVKIAELAAGEILTPSLADPVIWKFMTNNIHALNQSKEFKESFAKYKNYYAELMMMDNLSSDDDGQHKKKDDDDDMSIMDFYT